MSASDTGILSIDAQMAIMRSKVAEHEKMLKGNGGDGIDKTVTRMDEKIESIQRDIGWIKKGILAIIVVILATILGMVLTSS